MLTFMNSKLTKMTGKDKQIWNIQYRYIYIYIYIYIHIYIGEDREFSIHVFYWCAVSNKTMKSIYTKCKNTYNLIEGISSHNICSGIKSQVKKNSCHSVPKTFDFSQNSFVPFHRVTFDHSISCVLLIDKPNGSCQDSKKFGRNVISF